MDYIFPIAWKESQVDWIWSLIFFWAIPGVTWVAVFFPILLIFAWREKRYQLFKSKWDILSWTMLGIFLWMLVGVFQSDPAHLPLKLLEQKLTWLVMPLLVFLVPAQLCKDHAIRLFSCGVALAALMMLGQAAFHQMSHVEGHIWTGSNFTHPFHRSYWAAYAFFGALYFLNEALTQRKVIFWITGVWLMTTVFLSESKAGTIMVLVLLPLFVIIKGMSHFNVSKSKVVVMGLLLMLTLVLSIAWIPQLNYRFQSAAKGVTEMKWEHNPSDESTQARMLMWRAAWECWKDAPIAGHGLADANFEMKEWNIAKDNKGVAESALNAHNQFLQLMVQGGIIALGLFLFWLVILLQKSTQEWLRWWWAIVVLSLLFEAFFETRLGLVPVMIFTMIWKLQDEVPARYIK